MVYDYNSYLWWGNHDVTVNLSESRVTISREA